MGIGHGELFSIDHQNMAGNFHFVRFVEFHGLLISLPGLVIYRNRNCSRIIENYPICSWSCQIVFYAVFASRSKFPLTVE